jgi:hypothetical protein
MKYLSLIFEILVYYSFKIVAYLRGWDCQTVSSLIHIFGLICFVFSSRYYCPSRMEFVYTLEFLCQVSIAI